LFINVDLSVFYRYNFIIDCYYFLNNVFKTYSKRIQNKKRHFKSDTLKLYLLVRMLKIVIMY